jgi:hypothetical protein
MSASAMQNLGKARQTTPDTGESVSSYLNGPHGNGPASVRTGLQTIPSPIDAGAALQSSASQIARLQFTRQEPAGGSRIINLTA